MGWRVCSQGKAGGNGGDEEAFPGKQVLFRKCFPSKFHIICQPPTFLAFFQPHECEEHLMKSIRDGWKEDEGGCIVPEEKAAAFRWEFIQPLALRAL